MTAERLSELQDLALAGRAPEGRLSKEEAQAWETIRKRMSEYEQRIKSILRGGTEHGESGN